MSACKPERTISVSGVTATKNCKYVSVVPSITKIAPCLPSTSGKDWVEAVI
jgi:hypothetical protein